MSQGIIWRRWIIEICVWKDFIWMRGRGPVAGLKGDSGLVCLSVCVFVWVRVCECDRQGTPVTLTGSDSPWPVSVLSQCVAAPGWREAAFGWGGAKGCRLHCTPEGLDPNLQTQECYTTPPSHQTVPSRVLAYRAVVQSHHHVYIYTHLLVSFLFLHSLIHALPGCLLLSLFSSCCS